MLRRWLVERGADEGDVAEVTIAVSEACANAIEHAYAPVAGQLRAGRVWHNGEVTVADPRHRAGGAPRGARTGVAACR